MQLRKSERKQAKIKLALQGSAGSGKTYSSLLLANGLTNEDFSKVAIIDTENGSADLYAHLGQYNVLSLKPPFTPEKYIEAINICLKANMEVIILDSISQVWDELLDFHSKLPGNSFTNWNKVTPRQKAFVDKILQADAHVIATMRTKQDYVLNQKDGKYIPEKVGLKAVQRDGVDYEFTLVFDIDIKHFAVASKDRTNLFSSKPEFIINASTGRKIREWCEQGTGTEVETLATIAKEIIACTTISGLHHIYKKYPEYQAKIKDTILLRKTAIENIASQVIPNTEIIQQSKNNQNGIDQNS
jgi:hypothetical protein